MTEDIERFGQQNCTHESSFNENAFQYSSYRRIYPVMDAFPGPVIDGFTIRSPLDSNFYYPLLMLLYNYSVSNIFI